MEHRLSSKMAVDFGAQAIYNIIYIYITYDKSLLGLSDNINMFGVVPAHQRLIFDVGTILVYIPLLICAAGFVYSHCTRLC